MDDMKQQCRFARKLIQDHTRESGIAFHTSYERYVHSSQPTNRETAVGG